MELKSSDQAMQFARNWVSAWNARDLELILEHFVEGAEFVSPLAERHMGSPIVRGKSRIRAYWTTALKRISELRFELVSAHWDANARMLTVVYIAELDGRRVRSCEIMRFNQKGRHVRGEAFYGATEGAKTDEI